MEATKSRARKSSPSDLTQRKVIDGKATANVKGATGHSLAAVIFAEAEAAGAAMEKVTLSRKDKLALLIGFDKANRDEFKADLLARQEQISGEAKAVSNRTLRDYLDDFPRANAVYTECSMWTRMVKAVDVGWTPKSDKGETLEQSAWPEWRLLTMQATKALDAKGKPSKDGKNPELAQSNKRKRGRQPVSAQTKAVNAVKAALKDDKGNALPVNNRNLAEVIRGILADATLEELNEVAAVVQTMRDSAIKAKELSDAALDKANKGAGKAKPGQPQTADQSEQRTSAGATVKHTKAGGEGERQGVVTTENPSAADKLIRDLNKGVRATPSGRAKAKA